MFEQTLLKPKDSRRRGEAFLASLTAQILIGGVFIVVPLLYTQVLPAFELDPLPLPRPNVASPPPTPEPVQRAPTRRAPVEVIRPFVPIVTRVPRQVPNNLPESQEFAEPVPSIHVGGEPFEYSNSEIGGVPGGLPGIGDSLAPPPAPVADPEPFAEAPAGPVVVSSSLQAARLVRRVDPVYPAIARPMRLSGNVRLTARIAKDGTIQGLEPLAGNPILVRAAMEAVRQWVYQPTILNGEPVEVVTEIDVNFVLR